MDGLSWVRVAVAVVLVGTFVAALVLFWHLENEYEREHPGWP